MTLTTFDLNVITETLLSRLKDIDHDICANATTLFPSTRQEDDWRRYKANACNSHTERKYLMNVLEQIKNAKVKINMEGEMNVYDEFINEIRKYGMSKLSKDAGISINTISTWVHKKNVPSLTYAMKVADVMGLEFLLFDKET